MPQSPQNPPENHQAWCFLSALEQIRQAEPKLVSWTTTLENQLDDVFNPQRWGDLPRWLAAYHAMPQVTPSRMELNADTLVIGQAKDLSPEQKANLLQSLRAFVPWRKGPFDFFGEFIDTEWRSDWKWQRLLPHLPSLRDKLVLDVGCGSGYHTWRMAAAGARLALGIDPMPQYFLQFQLVQKYAQHHQACFLPLPLEALPAPLPYFDMVFSMGVLYHRRSPLDHLFHLKQLLKPGGTLVLETLIVEGEEGYSLLPTDRYAQMRNVWFLPSIATLSTWLKRLNFKNVRCVDVNVTSVEEQRTTDWMPLFSLAEFLDPQDQSKTCEGYPAPTRAIFLAEV